MHDAFNLTDFLEPVHLTELSNDEGYRSGQLGQTISLYDEVFPDIQQADIVIVGCSEARGASLVNRSKSSADSIRRELYKLYFWHPELTVADIGNVRFGQTLADTYAALKTVVKELMELGKPVLILGGSHDLMLAQYQAFVDKKKIVEAVNVDALIDLDMESSFRSENFLMELLTNEPNYIRHYSHVGFQSYFVHPGMLETMDKLRFDCYRVGTTKENIEEMEPVIRNSDFLAFDISAISNAYSPSSTVSPNGFTGEEACALMRYAGLSSTLKSIGIYGYEDQKDRDQLTAKQISHMIWYYIDGRSRAQREAKLEDKDAFIEFHTAFAEVETTFLQSKKTGRWWMQLPDRNFIACSYNDYLIASSNETPERWLRAQERL